MPRNCGLIFVSRCSFLQLVNKYNTKFNHGRLRCNAVGMQKNISINTQTTFQELCFSWNCSLLK